MENGLYLRYNSSIPDCVPNEAKLKKKTDNETF